MRRQPFQEVNISKIQWLKMKLSTIKAHFSCLQSAINACLFNVHGLTSIIYQMNIWIRDRLLWTSYDMISNVFLINSNIHDSMEFITLFSSRACSLSMNSLEHLIKLVFSDSKFKLKFNEFKHRGTLIWPQIILPIR